MDARVFVGMVRKHSAIATASEARLEAIRNSREINGLCSAAPFHPSR